MHWSTTPSKARCFRSDGVVRKRPNALDAWLSNGFGDVAARRAPCRVFPARVASLPRQAGKTAVRGFVGECAGGREPRFWGRRGGSILVRDKARGSQVPLRAGNTAPQCGSGSVFRGGQFYRDGVWSGISTAEIAQSCGVFPGSARGYPQKYEAGRICMKIKERLEPEYEVFVPRYRLRRMRFWKSQKSLPVYSRFQCNQRRKLCHAKK